MDRPGFRSLGITVLGPDGATLQHSSRPLIERQANARLIAAAPETTAEGQALIDELDRTDLMPLRPQDRERIEIQVRRLRAAIAKATGED